MLEPLELIYFAWKTNQSSIQLYMTLQDDSRAHSFHTNNINNESTITNPDIDRLHSRVEMSQERNTK